MKHSSKRTSALSVMLIALSICANAEALDFHFAQRSCVSGHGTFIVESYQNGVSDEMIRTAAHNETDESLSDEAIAGLRKLFGIMRPEEVPSNVFEHAVYVYDAAHQYKKTVALTETEMEIEKHYTDEFRGIVSSRISGQTYCRDESQLAMYYGEEKEGRTNYFATIYPPEEFSMPPFTSFGLVGYYLTEEMLNNEENMVVSTNMPNEITIIYRADIGDTSDIDQQSRIELVLDAERMVVKTYRWFWGSHVWHEHKYEDYVRLSNGEWYPRHSEMSEYVPASGIPMPLKREVYRFLGDSISLNADDDSLFKSKFPRRTKVVDFRFDPPYEYVAQ